MLLNRCLSIISPLLCCAVSKAAFAHIVLDGVSLHSQLFCQPKPFLGFLPAGEQRRQHGAGGRSFSKLSSVGHQVAWLLGTSCCLVTGGGVCQYCRELLPLHVALNSWQELNTVGLPRWPSWPAAPGWMPWLVPGVGPSPGSCAVLFGKALADVVDLNCFLIIFSFRAGAASHQPRL